jgi:hypothetical protein
MTAETPVAEAKTLDQIEAPADLKQMVDPASPRQAAILDQFLNDLGIPDGAPAPAPEEEAAAPKKLAGKYDSPEQLEKAYEELQRKLGQKAEQTAPPEAPEPAAAPEDYTPERGVEVYGETVATAIEAAEINPFEMAAKLEAGEDVAPYVDALVEKGGLPRSLVETYLAGVKPQAPAAAAAAEAVSLNDNPEAVAALRQSVGGDAAFERLSRWAAVNLSDAEKADYQAAVDSGNVLAAQWALRAMQARATGIKQEPDFLGGGAQTSEPADVYESRSDWQKERYAKDDNGSELYARDESYQRRVDAKHQRSKRAGKW